MLWFYRLARTVVWVLVSIVFDVRYEGEDNIPARGGYIMACNHTSYLDPIVLTFRQRPWIRYMAKAELTHIKGLRWLFRWLGIVPVERGTGDISAIDRCAELTEAGYVLGIFPEGTRFPQGEPGRPKSGMALIAKMTGADILPCAVSCERPMRFRSRITVKYGALIPHSELGLDEDSPRALKKATKRVWGSILELLGIKGEAQ